jgi:predicted enzyme related to lactoylglutathione lyase
MADIDKVEAGTLCWADLGTTDPAAAKRYYGELFGWSYADVPMNPGVYSLAKVRGRDAAALYQQNPEARAAGMPPSWCTYIAVDDVDATLAKATSLGGVLVMPPFDVPPAGRMAAIADPTGAILAVWKGNQHAGAGVRDEPGALTWTELATRDTKAAESFYTKLFGWTAKSDAVAPAFVYTEWSNGGRAIGGMMSMDGFPKEIPPYWMVYFVVNDVDAATATGSRLGGTTIVPPRDIPNVGRFSVLKDGQGAVFAVIKLVSHG